MIDSESSWILGASLSPKAADFISSLLKSFEAVFRGRGGKYIQGFHSRCKRLALSDILTGPDLGTGRAAPKGIPTPDSRTAVFLLKTPEISIESLVES